MFRSSTRTLGWWATHVALGSVDVAGLGDHLEVLLGLEQHPQAVAHDLVIVRENDLDRRTENILRYDPPTQSIYTVEYPDRELNRLTTAFRIFTAIPIADRDRPDRRLHESVQRER